MIYAECNEERMRYMFYTLPEIKRILIDRYGVDAEICIYKSNGDIIAIKYSGERRFNNWGTL